MHRFLILASLLLVGCSGGQPGIGLAPQNEPPQYEAAPNDSLVQSNPPLFAQLMAASTLYDFVGLLALAIERHDWYTLAYGLNESDYVEQFTFMKRDDHDRSDADVVAQILAETIGLGMVDNNLRVDGRRDPDDPFAGLNLIRNVEINTVDPSGSEYRQVHGVVTLEDGTSRFLSFTVSLKASGEWRVDVPLG